MLFHPQTIDLDAHLSKEKKKYLIQKEIIEILVQRHEFFHDLNE
jgi:hypothetical protein